MFAIRASVLAEAYEDPTYGTLLDKAARAGSPAEIQKLLVKFCREHGYRVAEVPLKNRIWWR